MPEINKYSCAKTVLKCLFCGSTRELDKEEEEYNRHFGYVAKPYICNGCKNAIEWAKNKMKTENEGEKI